MKPSVVITTYNWKEALWHSVQSILAQTCIPEEIIIADDGSTPDTGLMVNELARQTQIPLIHSWQEDKGFRAAKCRNRAIGRARGDYIILLDGDMIVDRQFIHDHLLMAKPGFFVQGSRVLLLEKKTREILSSSQFNINPLSAGIGNRKNCIRSTVLSRIFSGTTSSLKGIRTCNFAFWKQDALKINGFNEDFMGWGREDSEFAARLINSGIYRKNLKYMATAFHLHHPEHMRTSLEANNQILKGTVDKHLSWCKTGIDQYLRK